MKKIIMVIAFGYINLIMAADLYGAKVEVQFGSGTSSVFSSGVLNSEAMQVNGFLEI